MGDNYQTTKTPRNGGNASLERVNEAWKKTKPAFELSKDETDKWTSKFIEQLRNEK